MHAKSLPLAVLVSWPCWVAGCREPRAAAPAVAPIAVDVDSERRDVDGTARGYPEMRSLKGETIGKGEFSQWLEGDRLHVRARYDMSPTRWTEERSVMLQEPVLVHERWSFVEMRNGEVYRRFEVDFRTGNATADKREGKELRHWSKHLDVELGRAFAGGGWPNAIRRYRDRLLRGEKVELQAVGFTPTPRTAMVEITHDGFDCVPMSDRRPTGDRYRIHPKIPWIAKPFVDAPDSLIWLTHEPPAAFLRWEGPLVEPDDPVVRVDLLPGGTSEPAFATKP